jgi:hypothetical protein
MSLPLFCIVIGAGLRLTRNKPMGVLLVTLMLSGLMLMASCGGNGHSSGNNGRTPAGTYNITVTGSANGAASQDKTLALTVQ